MRLDLEPERRAEMMWANGGASAALPQLHVGGRYYGDAEQLQQLEDEGRLDALLWSVATTRPVGMASLDH